jgi:DNA-binding response OmpR family regulator
MRKKILVVDDEESLREMLNVILTLRGYDVTGVGTPEEAMEALIENKYDLIILDIILGKSNGLDLIKPIRELHPNIPIIIFTGAGKDEKLMKRAFNEGATGYLVKTEPINEIITSIRQHLK